MDSRRMIKSAGVVGAFTMLSRGLGLVRDVLMASVFGTSLAMSAFVVAFTIPNLFRRLFGEGALAASFVPVFVDVRSREGEPRAWDLAGKVATLLVLVLSGFAVAGILAASAGLGVAEPGGKTALILSLLRIMLPYMIFICLAALSMAALNALYHFAVPAATPCLLNIVWIAALLAIVPHVGGGLEGKVHAVAWAVLLAGGLQLLVQVPVLLRFGWRPRWAFDPADAEVRRVASLMGPAAVGMAVVQVNVVVDKLLAAWAGPWAPAALFFSERLIYFPLGIFATALGTVLLPVFSAHAAEADEARMRRAVGTALRNMLFVMTPAAVGLLVMAEPIVEMIFESGRFGGASTARTTIALQFYAPGLLVFSLVKVFVPAFYALKDTRTPVRIGVMAVLLNLGLNIAFVLTWPAEMKHAGLAFATVLSSVFNTVVLAVLLQRRLGSPGWPRVTACAARAAAASAAMAAAALLSYPALRAVGEAALPDKAAQVAAVATTIALAALAYFAAAAALRSPELRDILAAFRRRRRD